MNYAITYEHMPLGIWAKERSGAVFLVDKARHKINSAQAQFLDRLAEILNQ